MPRKAKRRRDPVPAIPQLSFRALDDVQKIERYARQQLRECEHTGHINSQKAERILRTCTTLVLQAELAYYESLPTFHEKWVIQLQREAIESAMGMLPDGYGDEWYEHLRNVLWDTTNADLNPPKREVAKQIDSQKRHRLQSTVTSLSAARKLEAYIQRNAMGLTEFANKAGTTDRTLRNFRKTGTVRRDIFEGIAKAMGITREALLSETS
jgi:hypothetical protein